MALISSATVTHAGASWTVKVTDQDSPGVGVFPGVGICTWCKDGVAIQAYLVPEVIRDGVWDAIHAYAEKSWYRG